MEALIERCCGLDVHRDSIEACLLTGKADEKPEKEQRTFGTMSHDLEAMVQWLREHGCTHVAMESTGVYWMAPYKALEPYMNLVVGNAQHLSKVPGRKTDVLDSEWLAELLRHGLIRKSFIPPPPIRELRDLTRYRSKLVQSRSAERNRLQKLLESANIKLASVMSNVFGASGMDILHALVKGELSAEEMSKLARGQLRKKMELLALALDAPFEEHQRYLLSTQLARLSRLDSDIDNVEKRITKKLESYSEQHARLMQIPGVSHVVASVIIAEIGVDMSVFASAEACASWAGLSPGNNESAGKRKSGRTPRGNKYLKSTLVEAAQSASRKKGSYFRDKFHKIRARRGYKRAAVAIAHKILLTAYHLLRTGEHYRDLGSGYLDARNEQRLTRRLVERLEGLGYRVSLESRESATEAAIPALQQGEISARQSTDTSAALDPVDAPRPVQTVQEAHRPEQDSAASAAESPELVHPSQQVSAPADSSTTVTSLPGQHQTALVSKARPTVSQPKPTRRKRARDPRLPPAGTILTRTFRDVEYRVTVLDHGFEHDGEIYSSISRVATVITGTSCSGYRFFRLTRQEKTAPCMETQK